MTSSRLPAGLPDDASRGHPGENGKVRILLADGSPITQVGIRAMLEDFSYLEIVGLAHDESIAVASSAVLNPDIVLINSLTISATSCHDIMHGLPQAHPELPPRTLMIISGRGAEIAQPAEIRPDGYVLIQTQPKEFAAAISLVAAGYRIAAPAGPAAGRAEHRRVSDRPRRLAKGAAFDILTQREFDVLAALACGWTNAQIAKKLMLSENTVKSHVQNLLTKLRLPNRSSAVAFAYEVGALGANQASG